MGIPLRVLLIEDSEDDAALLLLELRRGGYKTTHERVDTPAALHTALDNQKWDLVISDHSMPHFSGGEALQLLRQKESEVPFIFVSGTMGEEAAVAALKNGAQDYLMKSNLKRLVPAVQRELREAERTASEAVAIGRDTDFWWTGDALVTLAEVLRISGRPEEALPLVEEAVEIYEGKGAVPPLERAQALLAALTG